MRADFGKARESEKQANKFIKITVTQALHQKISDDTQPGIELPLFMIIHQTVFTV